MTTRYFYILTLASQLGNGTVGTISFSGVQDVAMPVTRGEVFNQLAERLKAQYRDYFNLSDECDPGVNFFYLEPNQLQ